MIATLHGTVAQVEDHALVVEVGGVGLRVMVPSPALSRTRIGEVVLLQTHLVVREDSLTIYGFPTSADRELFSMLLGVDGVGPRIALALLSALPLESIEQAVHTADSDALSRVPGVGKKTAQKIILHLQGRLKPSPMGIARVVPTEQDTEVLSALAALGYSIIEAQAALQSIPKDAPAETEERLRLALQHFQ